MEEKKIWDRLLEEAKSVINPRQITGFIDAGSVAAAILTDKGNIYKGVCIDTACTLGMCAERNAIANMITNGENKIVKLVCINKKNEILPPCGACREYLMQLDKDSKEIQILKDGLTYEYEKLDDLIPNWWGYDRY